jgi:hypothetical protein
MLLQRLGGFFTIVVAVAILAGVSTFDPPVAVQIILALLGSFVCLIGVVLAPRRPDLLGHGVSSGRRAAQFRPDASV